VLAPPAWRDQGLASAGAKVLPAWRDQELVLEVVRVGYIHHDLEELQMDHQFVGVVRLLEPSALSQGRYS
jgi:hypothetical protein